MQTGTQDRKKLIILAALVLVAAGVALRNFLPTRVRLPGRHHTAHTDTTLARLDPRLHLDRLEQLRSIRSSGNGRDLFRMGPAPAMASAQVASPRSGGPRPSAPPPIQPAGPPPPPPIDLKAFGYATQPGQPQKVFLVQGSEVYVAVQGGVVENRYQVLNIQPTTVLVKDLQTQQTATLPLPPSLITPGAN